MPAPPPPNTQPAAPPPRAAPTPSAGGPLQLTTMQPGESGRGISLIVAAVEGWGKTSMAAYMPDPAILMAREETGYLTLLAHRRVPSVPYARVDDWESLLETVQDWAHGDAKPPFTTLVLDALGGIERLCHEYVCRTQFNNDWGEKGFLSFNKGYEVSVNELLKLVAALERLTDRGCNVVLLSHIDIKPFKNPIGEDFDRFVPDLHQKSIKPFLRKVDAVLFGQFVTVIDKDGKGKGARKRGIGGTDRVLHCSHRDAWDAKNRLGLPDTIDIPNDPSQIWATIAQHIQEA